MCAGSPSGGRRTVVAAILWKEDRVLIARRHGTGVKPGIDGRWEFPGGKVEPGETHEAALEREIAEELGVRISIADARPVATTEFDYDHARIRLVAYRAVLVSGAIRPLDHAELRWVTPDQLGDYDLLPADRPIAARLCEISRE